MEEPSPIDLVTHIANKLGKLAHEVVFTGGAIVELLLNEAGSRPPRQTSDLDVVIEIASRLDFYAFEDQLRSLGFQNSLTGPTCRFENQG